MDINDIYEATRTRGLTRSRRQFSIEFSRMAPNYAADTGLARCSAEALLNLYKRLGETGHSDLQALSLARLLDAEMRNGSRRAVRP